MKRRRRLDGVGVLIALTCGLAILNCDAKSQAQTDDGPAKAVAADATPSRAPATTPSVKARRIRPEDLAYQGAFRLPDGPTQTDRSMSLTRRPVSSASSIRA